SAGKQGAVSELGAEPLVLDALDPAQVRAGVLEAKPEVIIHQLTAIGGKPDLKHFDTYFAATNRLRTEGTDNLLAAARLAGVRRFVAQSYTGWSNPRTGGPIKTEQDGLAPNPTVHSRHALHGRGPLQRAGAL